MVKDGIENSDPSNTTITATSTSDEIIALLIDGSGIINDVLVPPDDHLGTAIGREYYQQINEVIGKCTEGNYQEALDKLEHDILPEDRWLCQEMGPPKGTIK